MNKIGITFLCSLYEKWKSGPEGVLHVLKWCMDFGLIGNQYECPKCGRLMKLGRTTRVSDGYEWLCRSRRVPVHFVQRSVRSGSWFGESKINIIKVLLMTEFFVYNRSQKDIMVELDLSSESVCNWRIFFRELCFEIVLTESGMIGGEGKIVEIVESKASERRHKRSVHLQGYWVYGGMERGTKKCFLRVIKKKDKKSLLEVIRTSILPGTTIISDIWRSYDMLRDEDFNQLQVNNCLTFKDLKSTHNSVNEMWNAMKQYFPDRKVNDQFEYYLSEYFWRKNHAEDDDLMVSFLEGIRRVYPPRTRDAVDAELKLILSELETNET